MARTISPERQKLKEEALSLRYDYGLSTPAIMAAIHVPERTVRHWVGHNSDTHVGQNSNGITHLEGDCLELLKAVPDNVNNQDL